MITHKHHILPRYMGGTDDPSNLVELTIEEHAQAHLELYNKHGDQRDLLAHRMLLGQVERQEVNAIIRSLPKTDQHKRKIAKAVSGEKNGMYGKTTSQKQKDSVSKALKGKKKNYQVVNNWKPMIGADNPRAKEVTWEGVTYPTLTAASKATGICRSTLSKRLKTSLPS